MSCLRSLALAAALACAACGPSGTPEDELRMLQQRFKELGRAGPGALAPEQVRIKRRVDAVRAQLRAAAAEGEALSRSVDAEFHPYWGSLLKDGAEVSSFGFQVETYADVYTRRVSCFYAYSPQQAFRSPHDLMPHEL